MKKIFPLLLLLSVFFLIPDIKASAYTGGIFDKQPVLLPPTENTTKLVTDGDLKTGVNVRHNYMKFDLPEVQDLTHYYIQMSNAKTGAIAYFYSDLGNTKLIKQQLLNSNTESWQAIDIKGVASVVLKPADTPDNTVYEVDFKSETPIEAFPVLSLKETHTAVSADLSWTLPNSKHIQAIVIKKNGVELTQLAPTATTYTANSLESDTPYVFSVLVKYPDEVYSFAQDITFTTNVIPDDIVPPGEVTMVAFEKTHNTSKLTWVNPLDSDFVGVKIFRNGTLIDPDVRGTVYQDTGLVPNTTYTYKIVTYDLSGNTSAGYIQSLTTDIEKDLVPPAPPIGISATPGNGSASIKWTANTEPDIKGYNIYVNGIKHNSAVIFANNYVIPGLSNETTYTITVTAVDTSDNESSLSMETTVKPDMSQMPIFSAKYDLTDVSNGTSAWFTALWPILAFAVGIPIAFYISTRIKTLFFA